MAFLGLKKSTVTQSTELDTRVFSVLLSERTVQALFWQVTDNHIEIVAQSELKFYFDENDSLIKLDECLQELGPESETVTQALFHLDSSFSDQDGVLPDKKDFLKFMTESLNLKPVGFAANIEALIQILQNDVPKKYNLVVEFTKEKTEWSLYQGNLLIENVAVANSADYESDLATGWQQMRGSLNGVSLENDLSVLLVSAILKKAELLNRSESFPVKNLETEFLGSEEILEKVVPPGAVALAKERHWLVLGEETEAGNETEIPAETEETDQASMTPAIEEEITEVEERALTPEEEAELKIENKKKTKVLLITGIVGGLIVVLLVIWFYIVQSTTARIVVTPKTQVLSKTAEIVIDPTIKTSDVEKLILAGEMVDQEFKAESALATTGKKKIGDQATGTVEITNKKETSEKKFEKGTVLVDGEERKFVLDEEIKVSGVKEEEVDGKTELVHRKVDAKVTAVEVGEEGNIDAGSKLTVGSYANNVFEATVKEKFTGGTSEDVMVVTATDQTKLQTALLEEIVEVAEKEISTKAENGRYFIPLGKSAVATAKDWSHDLDEETAELSLAMTVNVPAVAYNAEDLKPLASAILEKELPVGYKIATENEPQLMSSAIGETKKGESVKLKVDISNSAVAEVDVAGLNEQIAGNEIQIAESVLRTRNGIATVEIEFSNPLYKRFVKKMPKVADKIVIEVK